MPSLCVRVVIQANGISVGFHMNEGPTPSLIYAVRLNEMAWEKHLGSNRRSAMLTLPLLTLGRPSMVGLLVQIR